MSQVVLRAGDIPPPLNERYLTQLDGQSKYWRRIDPDYGQTTTATLECLFVGGGGSGFQLVTGRHSDDRFYIGINNANSVVFGNGSVTSGETTVDRTKINHAKLTADGTNVTFYVNGVQISQVAQTWSGLLDQVGFGAKDAGTANFYDGIQVSSRVTTDTEVDIYPLDKNLAYELANGTTDPLADSTLIFENGSIDGSDRLLVDPTGTGFEGQDEWADAIKTLTGEATAPTPSSILINETGATLSGVSIPARVGVILRVSGDADITSGQIDLSVNSNLTGVAASITASGTFTFDLESNGFIGFKRAFTGGAVAELTNLKVIAIYDYATGAAPVDSYGTEYSTAYS
tara:strand:- start:3937 stop:4971 length:1035 start_codon:yes stop_codon:yes gene_type:complete